ncbi:hypothetical protein D3C84_1284570 [compost metagenome]
MFKSVPPVESPPTLLTHWYSSRVDQLRLNAYSTPVPNNGDQPLSSALCSKPTS